MNVRFYPEVTAGLPVTPAPADRTLIEWRPDLAPEALLPALGELFCRDAGRETATLALAGIDVTSTKAFTTRAGR